MSGEGFYVDGKADGRFVTRWDDGATWERSYVDGEPHGRFTMCLADGYCDTIEFHHGELVP